MDEVENQVRLLAERRFARLAPAPAELVHDIFPSDPDTFAPDEGDLLMVDVQTRPTGDEDPAEAAPRKRLPYVLLAAAAIIVVVIGVAIFSDDDGQVDVADNPTDDAQDSSGSANETVVFGPASSLAVVNGYFAAYNAGDADSLLALFAPDAVFSASHDNDPGEIRLVWSLAQGATLTEPDCMIVDEVVGSAVTISCEYGSLQATGVAVGEEPIGTTTQFVVTPDGISDLNDIYAFRHFMTTGLPFRAWMEENHPADAEAAGCCGGDTFEEAVARGELRARYTLEWAADLEANG